MTKGILCTTDFSEPSKEALKWAIRLAQKLDSPLTILYTYRIFKMNGEAVAAKRRMEAEALKNFAVLENELLKDSHVRYDFKTEIGFVSDRVEEHCKNHATSFLVMGKNMTSHSGESIHELVEHLHLPLVIVPK